MAAKTLPIELDKARTLKRSMRAVRLIHEATGQNIIAGDNPLGAALVEGETEADGSPKVDRGKLVPVLCKVLWAFLEHEDRALTPEAIEEMLDFDDLLPVTARVMELLSPTEPQPEAARPLPESAAPSPAGSGSAPPPESPSV
jgi:hypothetical protein